MMSFSQQVKEKFSWDWFWRIFLILLIILSIVGAFYANKLVRRLVAGTKAFSLPGDPVIAETKESDDENVEGMGEPQVETPSTPDNPSPSSGDGQHEPQGLVYCH